MPHLPSPGKHLSAFCRWIYLFWILVESYNVTFYVFFSLRILISRLIHIVTLLHSFYCSIILHCMDISSFVNLMFSWLTFGFFPPFGHCEQCCCEQLFTCMCLYCICLLDVGFANIFSYSVGGLHFFDDAFYAQKFLKLIKSNFLFSSCYLHLRCND